MSSRESGTPESTQALIASQSTFVDVLERSAEARPAWPMYTFLADDGAISGVRSTGELLTRARTGAARLQQACRPGDRVLLLAPPGLDYIDCFFACLAAGVYAVPAYPPDPMRLVRTVPRLQAIVRDAQPAAVLTTSLLLALAEPLFELAPELRALEWIAIDDLDPALASRYARPSLSHDDIAFLQYTSGSTGDPRGVMLTHQNVLVNVCATWSAIHAGPGSRIVSWMPPYHDFGLCGSVLLALVGGAQSFLMSPIAFLRAPIVWLRAVTEHRGTITQAANFALEYTLRKIEPAARSGLDLSSVSLVGVGGEIIRADSVARFEDAFAPYGLRRGSVAPGWGLAESTMLVTATDVGGTPIVTRTLRLSALRDGRVVESSALSRDSMQIVSGGRPLPGNRVLAVDPDLHLALPAGHVGELWVSGPSVARGYWCREEDTRAAFDARLADTGDGPFLRTGDLGFVDDGDVFITGRMKEVIIVRGQNHYPQDVERSIEACDAALRPGCGAAFSADIAGEERLVVVWEIDPRRLDDPGVVAEALRAAVSRDHDLQVYEVVLLGPGNLPKTSSGKIQRQPCRRQYLDGTLDAIARIGVAGEVPLDAGVDGLRNAAERILAWLVAEVAATLEVDAQQVSPDLAMATLGLDSLAAVSLAQGIEDAFQCRVPTSSFFDEMSLRELAEVVGTTQLSGAAARGTLAAARGGAEYPLSRGQRGLWFLHRLAPASTAYNLALAARIRGPLEAAALRRAFEQVVARHEALRGTFHVGADGEPVQRVHPGPGDFFIEVDAAGVPSSELEERARALAARPFDLASRAPLRVALFRRSALEHVLVVVCHHLIADFWSLMVVNRELRLLYEAAVAGTEAKLPAVAWQYRDHVHAEQQLLASPPGEGLWRFWEAQLTGELAALDLPTDRARPAVQGFRGASLAGRIDEQLGDRIRSAAASAATTPYVLLLAAFQAFLHRYARQSEVIVGSPLAGRGRREWRDVVGYFANALPLRARFAGDPTFAELVTRTRIAVLGAIDHQELPFPSLVERRSPPRDPSRSPIFQAQFVMPDAPISADEGLLPVAIGASGAAHAAGPLLIESWLVDRAGAQLDLSLTSIDADGGYDLLWEYDTDLFDAATVARMAHHYRTLLESALADPAARVSGLALLDADERRGALADANATALELPADPAVHRLLEAQVARTPDAPAVVLHGDHISYRELDRRALALAARLRREGVTRGSRVGVLVERSIDMVVALLGVLKAGAAYVPLDPALPLERLRFMARDAEIGWLVVHAETAGLLADAGLLAIRVDEATAEAAPAEVERGSADVLPDDLAYVIYTSGSTGKPKGVAVSHRALANLLCSMRDTPGLGPDDTLVAVTTISFDIAALEIFLPLMVGARLVIASRDQAGDAQRLRALLDDSQATALQATPVTWRMLIDAGWIGRSGFKALCGGDVLSRDLADALLARAGSVWNLYGPTETTIWSAVAPVTPGKDAVPIGRPIANTQLHVLDERLEPLPAGVRGELYVGGLGLAAGYVGLPELTRERFIAGPAGLGRLYRTGDLARRRPDGQIELLGRNDRQVKLRGFRVELDEIEAVLGEHPAVSGCAVILREEGVQSQIAAYLVPRSAPIDADQLRAWLRDRLPSYMIPASFAVLERLPVTPAGKVDRRTLAAQQGAGETPRPIGRPARTDRERLLAEIWRQALAVEQLGADDDFFSLGGDSLRAAQVAARISRATGRDVGVRLVLEHPTVAAMARHLDDLPATELPTARSATLGPAAGAAATSVAARGLEPFVEIERRPLLTLVAARKIEPVDAAAIAYLPASLSDALEVSREEIVDDWFGGLPLFAGVLGTPLGRVGLVLLPHFDDALQQDFAVVLSSLREAIGVAGQIGARVVSLTGLLPAFTDQGRDVAEAGRGDAQPAITTGHATTAATVVLSIDRILAESARELRGETVAFLGLGSIGVATLRLMLRAMPHPESILLCDVYRKREHLAALRRALIDELGVTAPIEVLEARDAMPARLYEATLVVGATNVPGILDVARLRPRTLIVDDSAPHCFDPAAAEARLVQHGDILFTEGGVLRAPEPLPRLLYVPRGAERLARLLPMGLPGMPGVLRAEEITGCVLSSLLSARFTDLPPTLGPAGVDESVRHHERLRDLGFEAAELHCERFTPPADALHRFRALASPEPEPEHDRPG